MLLAPQQQLRSGESGPAAPPPPTEAWNRDTLAAFVELLGDLMRLDLTARLDLEDFVLAEVRNRFRRAVSAYLAASE